MHATRLADPVGGRSRASVLRLRRRPAGRRGRRLAAHHGRQPAAVRPRGDHARRDHAGAPRRHLPRPRGGRHRPLAPGRQGLLHRDLRRDLSPGIDLHGHIDDAGDALGAVAAGKKIDGLTVGGHGASVTPISPSPSPSSRSRARSAGSTSGFNDISRPADRLRLRLRRRRGAGRRSSASSSTRRAAGGSTWTRSCTPTRSSCSSTRACTTCAPTATCRRRCARWAPAGSRADRRARRSGAEVGRRQRSRPRAAPRARRALPPTVRVHGNAHLSPRGRHLRADRRDPGRQRDRQG